MASGDFRWIIIWPDKLWETDKASWYPWVEAHSWQSESAAYFYTNLSLSLLQISFSGKGDTLSILNSAYENSTPANQTPNAAARSIWELMSWKNSALTASLGSRGISSSSADSRPHCNAGNLLQKTPHCCAGISAAVNNSIVTPFPWFLLCGGILSLSSFQGIHFNKHRIMSQDLSSARCGAFLKDADCPQFSLTSVGAEGAQHLTGVFRTLQHQTLNGFTKETGAKPSQTLHVLPCCGVTAHFSPLKHYGSL